MGAELGSQRSTKNQAFPITMYKVHGIQTGNSPIAVPAEPAARSVASLRLAAEKGSPMADDHKKPVRLPPRWFIRTAWAVHRGLYRITGGRFGLRRVKGNRWGMMHLTTIGRRTGQKRQVILAYFEDGPNLVTIAMNGWGKAEPAWWLNLQAHPEVTVDLADGPRKVRGRAAEGEERDRLWDRWRYFDANLDEFAALRPGETAVVVLEPSAD